MLAQHCSSDDFIAFNGSEESDVDDENLIEHSDDLDIDYIIDDDNLDEDDEDDEDDEEEPKIKTVTQLTGRDTKRAYVNKMWEKIKEPEEDKKFFLRHYTGREKPNTLKDLDKAIVEINRRLAAKGYTTGSGFGRIRGRGIIAENANYSDGIMQTNKHVPFGRFFINNHKLNDNIVSLKRPHGGNVCGLPVERVTAELGEVLRTITGGGQPTFNQLEKLSSEEKAYLYKIAKQSNIIDRLSIPTPNKDDDDKDINQFEIMKGEILAGNDSSELVRKFKLLIIKMTKKNLLPKGQAKDLLMDLATLGY
jgi:hypothetical protein